MKVIRSSKCTLKFATQAKREKLHEILSEYGKVTNFFINYFWNLGKPPTKGELLKPIVDLPSTWLSACLRQTSAREALSMIKASKNRWGNKAKRPAHKGTSMYLSSATTGLTIPRHSSEFDGWLHLNSLGRKLILDLPVRFHKHFNRLAQRGTRLNSYIIHKDYVQFAFEIETGPKRTEGRILGVDTGINALATTSEGAQLGTDIKDCVERIKRCKHGSKGQVTARRAMKQRMDEVAKELVEQPDLQVVITENLRNLNKGTKVKRRLTKSMRRSLGAWAYRYWLGRVEGACEDNRVVFRSVNPAYTSQRCNACGHTERGNRTGKVFLCRKCDHADNADINAAKNILVRFTWGPYGAPFKPSGTVEGETGRMDYSGVPPKIPTPGATPVAGMTVATPTSLT